MCKSCGCDCKMGKPDKRCECPCSQCNASRESVAKSLVDLVEVFEKGLVKPAGLPSILRPKARKAYISAKAPLAHDNHQYGISAKGDEWLRAKKPMSVRQRISLDDQAMAAKESARRVVNNPRSSVPFESKQAAPNSVMARRSTDDAIASASSKMPMREYAPGRYARGSEPARLTGRKG